MKEQLQNVIEWCESNLKELNKKNSSASPDLNRKRPTSKRLRKSLKLIVKKLDSKCGNPLITKVENEIKFK